MDFGFTNDERRYNNAIKWRDLAIADGWEAEPTYQNEPIHSATTLAKDGFKAMILTRTNRGKWAYEVSISIWGPDGLAVSPPNEYDWSKISAGERTCNYCNAENVDTVRVGFAGRCCKDCLPEVRKRVEFPGWYN